MPPSKKGKVVAGQRDRKLDAAFRSTVRSALKGIPVDGLLQDPWDELERLVMRIATAGSPRR